MAGADHIEAVVFDIGGTLFDFTRPESWRDIRAGVRLAYDYLVEQGCDVPSFPRYRRRIERRILCGYLWSRICRTELDTLGQLRDAHAAIDLSLDDAKLTELSLRFYAPVRKITRVEPGLVPAIEELRLRGYLLALISNTIAPPAALDAHLADEGLLGFFPLRVYSCVVGVPKPNPRIFNEALEALGIAPRLAMYVGDKPRIDVRGARRVGMMSVLRVPDGKPAPPGPRPDFQVRRIADLLEILPPRTMP